ncbi:MAG: hypothetical protein HQK60_00940 [Deltaproteobacteria bacterium]|nr:hypothetical protein [Deltaproteobacteria bacterium]
MTTQPIGESKMTFGPYPDGHCFYIEKSATYQKIQQGVKMAEFLLLRFSHGKPPVVWVVEAKESAPHPETEGDETKAGFDKFIADVREKLVNAFSLCVASCLKRHAQAEEELPEPYKALDLSDVGVRFVLVIKNHKDDWLDPIRDALRKSFQATVKTWALSPTSVVVLNEVLARQHGLILSANGRIT